MKKLVMMMGMLVMAYLRAENNNNNERIVSAKEQSADAGSQRLRSAVPAEISNHPSLNNDEETEWTLYIPNTFTPNSDGLNDVFTLYGTGFSSVTLEIYNRSGEKLFVTADVGKGWDGNYKGHPCETATYVYCTEVVLKSGEKVNKVGHVNLIR